MGELVNTNILFTSPHLGSDTPSVWFQIYILIIVLDVLYLLY